MKRVIDQEYCTNDYWCDYPRQVRKRIDDCDLTADQKEKIRKGESVSASDRNGTYRQYYYPIIYYEE